MHESLFANLTDANRAKRPARRPLRASDGSRGRSAHEIKCFSLFPAPLGQPVGTVQAMTVLVRVMPRYIGRTVNRHFAQVSGGSGLLPGEGYRHCRRRFLCAVDLQLSGWSTRAFSSNVITSPSLAGIPNSVTCAHSARRANHAHFLQIAYANRIASSEFAVASTRTSSGQSEGSASDAVHSRSHRAYSKIIALTFRQIYYTWRSSPGRRRLLHRLSAPSTNTVEEEEELAQQQSPLVTSGPTDNGDADRPRPRIQERCRPAPEVRAGQTFYLEADRPSVRRSSRQRTKASPASSARATSGTPTGTNFELEESDFQPLPDAEGPTHAQSVLPKREMDDAAEHLHHRAGGQPRNPVVPADRGRTQAKMDSGRRGPLLGPPLPRHPVDARLRIARRLQRRLRVRGRGEHRAAQQHGSAVEVQASPARD